MTLTHQPRPGVESNWPGEVDQPNPPGEGSHDQARAQAAVEPDLRPIPLFARLVRATRGGDSNQIDELREQLNGFGWSIEHRTENIATAADESPGLIPQAKLADSTNSLGTNPRTRRTKSKPEIPLDQRLTWDLNDIASLTGLSRRHFERLRKEGRMPPPDAKCGRRVLFFPKSIRDWLAQGGTA